MEREYVGIDSHRRRSVIVRTTPEGEVCTPVRIDNDLVALALALAEAGPEVVLEARGARVHAALGSPGRRS